MPAWLEKNCLANSILGLVFTELNSKLLGLVFGECCCAKSSHSPLPYKFPSTYNIRAAGMLSRSNLEATHSQSNIKVTEIMECDQDRGQLEHIVNA